MKKTVILLFVTFGFTLVSRAQMPRERSQSSNSIQETFWAPSIVVSPSITQVPRSNFNFTIQHAFGPVSTGIAELFGLDASANIRFGLDYGVTDDWSLGMGRSRYDKVVDFRTKISLIDQGNDGVASVAVFGNVGLDTRENGYSFSDRQSLFIAVLIARRINDRVSVQIAPSLAHFNLARELQEFGGGVRQERNDLYSVGFSGRYAASEQLAFMAEWMPVIGERNEGTENVLSIGANIETGGHIFQLYLTSTQWISPQYALSRSTTSANDGDLGFGFTVHRAF